MNKTWVIRILLLLAYCTPFTFLSVNGDAVCGTVLFYGVMVAGFALLYWASLKTNNIAILFLGNLLSLLSSYMAAKLSGLEPMGHYFKPFTSHSLIIVVSVVAIIVQTVMVLVHIAKHKMKEDKSAG